MALPAFTTWFQKQQIKIPDSDRLIPLIAQAGPQGMSRGEIGKDIADLDRDFLDDFLVGLVQVGVLRMLDRDGVRVYWAA